MDTAVQLLSKIAPQLWHLWDRVVTGVLALPPRRILLLISLAGLITAMMYVSADNPWTRARRHGIPKGTFHLLLNGLLAVFVFQAFLFLIEFTGARIPLWFELTLPGAFAVGIMFIILWEIIDRRTFDAQAFFRLAVLPLISPILPFVAHLGSLWRAMRTLFV